MSTPSGYDDRGEYAGPCPDCGTDHGGIDGPETLRGALACLQARAAGVPALADHIAGTRDLVNIAQANALGLPVMVFERIGPEGPCVSPDGHSLVDMETLASAIPEATVCTRCGREGAIVVFGEGGAS